MTVHNGDVAAPGQQRRSGTVLGRPRRSDFSTQVCALADAAKNHLRFKLAMGDVNKLGMYTNKGDWAWKIIEDTVLQKPNIIFKQALADAQKNAILKRNLTTYVSFKFSILIFL
jgi:hypothetical protein